MKAMEVFAEVGCPFAHVGLHRFVAYRQQRGRTEPVLRVRAWPLQRVNDVPHDGRSLTPKIDALRQEVAVGLFSRFDPDRFPTTTIPAMVAEAAAYRAGLEVGERFSLAVRHALFEEGLDVSDPDVLHDLRVVHRVPAPTDADEAAVDTDLAEGRVRGVVGSPHFFTPDGNFFCPALDIADDREGFDVSFDVDGFRRLVTAAFV